MPRNPSLVVLALTVAALVCGCSAEVAGQFETTPGRPDVSSSPTSPSTPPLNPEGETAAQICGRVDEAAATLRDSSGGDSSAYDVAQAHNVFGNALVQFALASDSRLAEALTNWASAAADIAATATAGDSPPPEQRRLFASTRKTVEKLCGHPLPRR